MKVATVTGIVVVVLIMLSLMYALAGRMELTVTRGIEYVVALLLLDAAQDADDRGDDVLSAAAALAAVFAAVLPLI
jgi:hypothetical protein